MRLGILILLLYITSIEVFSQEMNLLEVEFGSISNKENSVGINNMSVALMLPTKLKNGVLTNEIAYLKNSVSYNNSETIFTNELDCFQSIKYSLSYLNRINNKWNYKVQFSPTISSNFESSISFDDVILNGGVIFSKHKNKAEFFIGLLYNSFDGFNFPIPTVGYSNQINDKMKYILGVPLTKVEYNFNSRNKAKFYINPKGFTANLSNDIAINASSKSDKIAYLSIISGVKFSHKIDDYWDLSLDAGYQLYSNYELLNKNNTVYNFTAENSFYTGINLKFNLLNKKVKKQL